MQGGETGEVPGGTDVTYPEPRPKDSRVLVTKIHPNRTGQSKRFSSPMNFPLSHPGTNPILRKGLSKPDGKAVSHEDTGPSSLSSGCVS